MAGRIRYLILCLGIIASSGSVPAQTPTPPPMREVTFYIAAPLRYRKIRFGTFDPAGKITESNLLRFKTSGRSDPYEYKGPLPLLFFEEEPDPTPEDPNRVKRIPVAKVMTPPNVEEALILFERTPKPVNGLEYKTTWVDLGAQSIPPGHLGILNLTEVAFQGVLGKSEEEHSNKGTRFEVVPGINKAVEIHPVGHLAFALQTERYGWVTIYQDKFFCAKDEKYLLIVFPPRVKGSINVGCVIIPFQSPLDEEEDAAEGSSDPVTD